MDRQVLANQPDIVEIDKDQKTAVMIDVAMPRDSNIGNKYEKLEKYQGLKEGPDRMWKIFRRADKNDDGKLSFEEFKNCCADGILSSEELWKLFSDIDRHHSGNLETEKLCDYFSEHLGEYRHVLSALEQLNTAVLSAMDKTKLCISDHNECYVMLSLTVNKIQESMH
ncbi:N-terminal EF-hand calcium-binding protein 3-like, partial [Protobothrops mucrosquamatus]|uniref:N-terminal EF-hand calcium-binding protein 3-like n=1 Tax=Protobothrops mucrosquamatus TaxID=103944 RepID=UPI000775CB3F